MLYSWAVAGCSLILGLETSCDETSAALVEKGRRVLSNIVASQTQLHSPYGGVVPEIAARSHVEVVNLTIEAALKEANKSFSQLQAIAVTAHPGLPGALLVGLVAGRAVASSLGLPLIEVDHIVSHIYANFLETPLPRFPFLALVVSGGHTNLVLVESHGQRRLLGSSRDDAAGEALDKIARFFGLGYPGGPLIDEWAKKGNPQAIKFPRPYLPQSYDFSFSGLKTAVVNWAHKSGWKKKDLPDILASFQAAVVDVLIEKIRRAAAEFRIKNICLAGGVAANSLLRQRLAVLGKEKGWKVHIPSPALCTDNAAMVAAAGYFLS